MTEVTVNLSIDVPDLARGLRFYGEVFGLREIARPFPEMAVLEASNLTICMHAKPAGTKPAPGSDEVRHYTRHWTPVHVDFHVEDFEDVIERAQREGAVVEQVFRRPGRKSVAFCGDPFGNGFCVLGEEPDSSDG